MITIFDIGSGAVLDQPEPLAPENSPVQPAARPAVDPAIDLVNQDPALQIIPVQPEIRRDRQMPPDLARIPVSPFVERQK